MGKTQVNVQLDEARCAKVDRLRKEIPGVRCGTERSQFVAFLINSAIDALEEPAVMPRALPRKIVARPSPEHDEAHEGSRLREARIKAGLSHDGLATAINADMIRAVEAGSAVTPQVSRGQVQRAERAESLEQWPALRTWLLAQEAKP